MSIRSSGYPPCRFCHHAVVELKTMSGSSWCYSSVKSILFIAVGRAVVLWQVVLSVPCDVVRHLS